MTPADFADKQVYIPGGSLGIGLAIATRVAALGAHVTLFSRRKEPLDQAVAAVAMARKHPTQRVAAWQLEPASPDRAVRLAPPGFGGAESSG